MTPSITFENRTDAGRVLAPLLLAYVPERPIVLALPRGGVPVGAEVAKALNAPLEVLGVKKIGAPFNPEYAIGAVAEDGACAFNQHALKLLHLTERALDQTVQEKRLEAQSLGFRLRGGQALPDLTDRTVIVVDDGLATGMTALAAAESLRQSRARSVVFATPVCSSASLRKLRPAFQKIVCAASPEPFASVGNFYADFSQLSERETLTLLGRPPAEEVHIPCGTVALTGIYRAPTTRSGVIVFAHGRGSGRMSPRHQKVAQALQAAGLGTLLVDLLTETETQDRAERSAVELMAQRLTAAIRWLHPILPDDCRIGLLGASEGAAGALEAAVDSPLVAAVVSRGGRPDLAARLKWVRAPTLLIVGSRDDGVLELNRTALTRLRHADLAIVSHATHHFEEPGALEAVAALAEGWFGEHLAEPPLEVRPRATGA